MSTKSEIKKAVDVAWPGLTFEHRVEVSLAELLERSARELRASDSATLHQIAAAEARAAQRWAYVAELLQSYTTK